MLKYSKNKLIGDTRWKTYLHTSSTYGYLRVRVTLVVFNNNTGNFNPKKIISAQIFKFDIFANPCSS